MKNITPQKRREMVISSNTANCRNCNRIMSLENFYLFPSGMPRLDCKECHNIKTSEVLRTEKGRKWKRKVYDSTSEQKKRAWIILNKKIRNGTIVRPDVCSKCGDSGIIHGHHDDYSMPLSVIWLCDGCHKEHHRDLKS